MTFERFLRRESHRNAPDAQARQCGRRVHPEMAKDGQQARENHQQIPDLAEQSHQGRRGEQFRRGNRQLDVVCRSHR